MSKRRITEQQARRIKASRVSRASRGVVGSSTFSDSANFLEGLVIAHFGKSLAVWHAAQNAQVMCHKRQHLGPVVVGDRVRYQLSEHEGEDKHAVGVVIDILPRQTCLDKIGPRGQRIPMAANVDQMLIMIAPLPAPSQTTLDRYLALAEYFKMVPVILFNKWDLVEKEGLARGSLPESKQTLEQTWSAFLAPYRSIPYQVLTISTKSPQGWGNLEASLVDKNSVLVGQSGVGKSSFVKALIGEELDISIGELSREMSLGKHTTTVSRLYRLASGGGLIDSPGVREMALPAMSIHELLHCFVEFKPYAGHCQFRNCLHTERSKGCALWQAVGEGKLALSRLTNFCLIYESFGEAR